MADLADELGDLEDPYRWCVYCGADCARPGGEPSTEHEPNCPTVTGRYPVDHPRETQGPGGGPAGCCRCDHEFEEGKGEFYRLILAPGEDPDAPDGTTMADAKTYLVVCEDCAIAVELMGAPNE